MEFRNFSGSAFEIGKQIGGYYKACGFQFSPPSETELLRKQLAYYETFAPEVLEEFKGIAEGGDFDFNAVAHTYLTSEILYLRAQNHKACSIGSFKDASGDLWVARNYDWHPAVADVMQAWSFQREGRRVLAITDMGILGEEGRDKAKQLFLYEDAINNDGLFIGVTFAFCWNENIGLTSFDTVRLVASRCKTVGEAAQFFKEARLASAKNFFIADAEGNSLVVQHAGGNSFDLRTPDAEGLLAVTNHYVGTLEAEDQIGASGISDAIASFPRYARLMGEIKALKKAPVDFAALDKMMTASAPLSACIREPQVETVWTLLMNMPKREYRLIAQPRLPSREVFNLTL